MSIANQLLILSQTKNNIKESINLKGVEVTDEAFAEYPDKIRQIPNGGGWYESNVILFLERKIRTAVIPEGITTIGNSSFNDCASLTNVTIPDSVTSIGDSAFYDCSSLTSVIIPSSVTSISSRAFFKCSSLTSVSIGSGVTSIGMAAFYSCSSLTSVIIPDSVTSIGDNAFNKCTSLANVTIGNSVTNIGEYAYSDCSSLASVTVNATTPPTLGSSAFNSTNNCPIYVPDDSVLAYQTSDNWIEYANRIKGISEKPQ